MTCRGGSRGRVQGVRTPRDDLQFSNTTGILQKKTMWFIGVAVEQETSAPPPKKILDPPLTCIRSCLCLQFLATCLR